MSTRPPPSLGSFCPVAQASEVVAQRWVPLILREIMVVEGARGLARRFERLFDFDGAGSFTGAQRPSLDSALEGRRA